MASEIILTTKGSDTLRESVRIFLKIVCENVPSRLLISGLVFLGEERVHIVEVIIVFTVVRIKPDFIVEFSHRTKPGDHEDFFGSKPLRDPLINCIHDIHYAATF